MKIYIRSSACISAQNTFENDELLADPIEYQNTTRLKAIEPDYSAFIDPKQIRRMSHVIKMGVSAAKLCLHKADVEMPGAIITGTALGCLEDTVTFLNRMIEMQEELLPPTAFIQSTHNTVAAQIALMLKCHNYNNTFVHKGVSLESALLDAVMLLNEEEAESVLVGGIDEMTDTSFTVLTRLGLYKRVPISNFDLFDANSKGTIGGEGAAFFLLTNKRSDDNLAELIGQQVFYKPADPAEIERRILTFLAAQDLTISDIDLVITGKNGDLNNDSIYNSLSKSIFADRYTGAYKHLCGEYSTSSGFALWLASHIIKTGKIPSIIGSVGSGKPGKILIYNHYMDIYHSLMLVSTC